MYRQIHCEKLPDRVRDWNFHFHIHKACEKYKVDPILIYSLVLTESRGNPYAYRYEPDTPYYYEKWHDRYPKWVGIDDKSKKVLQKSSIGLCQVMGSTAIDLGFEDITTKMALPEVSLEYGVKYWYLQAKRFDLYNPMDIYFAYNTGYFDHKVDVMTDNVKAYGDNLEYMGYYNE